MHDDPQFPAAKGWPPVRIGSRRRSSVTKLLAGPDGSAIDITVRSADRQAAERWIATFREAHDLREPPPARPKGTSLERVIARVFPLLGWTMTALMTAAIIVVLAYLAGFVEPEQAGAFVGRLLMLAGPLVALVLVLIGVEARIRRADARLRSTGKRRTGVLAVGMAIVAGELLADAPPVLADGPLEVTCGSGGCGEVTVVGPKPRSTCTMVGTPGVFECTLDSMTGSLLSLPADVGSGMLLHSEGRGELTVTGSCTPAASGPIVPSSQGTILPAVPTGDEPERPLLPPLTEESQWVRPSVTTDRRA
ncbi:hypothetical protein [Microvirga pudoricolor]|uniref:hypothetical protein n=1 Tax=Microvirga pudoricolor TaxID=2778729 RepID=UPI0019512308|nr:hypothetical protein [Microvirga pudoricolor]MBM6595412.1 hypothetical protein [Microvirga pudoricolor]